MLEQLHDKFTIIAVTSRRRVIEQETLAWIDKYFKGIIDDIKFAGFYDNPDAGIGEKRNMTKTDILKSIDAKYFIDDQLKHCLGAAAVGIRVVLFGDYRWNQSPDLPSSVTRCATWYDVKNYFKT